jgi:Tyrosine-protein kinase ephrin type A/B receptor-like
VYTFNAQVKSSSFSQQADEVICIVDTSSFMASILLNRDSSRVSEDFNLNVLTSSNLDSLEPFKFTFYAYPDIIGFTPTSGPAQGGMPLTVMATPGSSSRKFPDNIPIKLKLGQYVQPEQCLVVNGCFNITCKTPAQPEDASGVVLSLTYNEGNNYLDLRGQDYSRYQPRPCIPGFTSDSYSKPCLPCPKGTYKPQEGFFSCILCDTLRY